MTTRPLVRADLVTGVVLLALGLAVLAESYSMPRLEERRINPWTAPGLVPGLLGLIIALLGGTLALRSAIAGAFSGRAPQDDAEAAEARAGAARLTICGVLCIAYAVVLLGRIPFWLATGLFVFAFIAIFEWRMADPPRARLVKLGVAALLAGATALAVPYVFETLFLVRLP
jgi:uncharacterized membrane protein